MSTVAFLLLKLKGTIFTCKQTNGIPFNILTAEVKCRFLLSYSFSLTFDVLICAKLVGRNVFRTWSVFLFLSDMSI